MNIISYYKRWDGSYMDTPQQKEPSNIGRSKSNVKLKEINPWLTAPKGATPVN